MIHSTLVVAPAQDGDVSFSGPCSSCGGHRSFTYPIDGVSSWLNGVLIQKALPSVSASKREWLKTAICPDCIEDMRGGQL